jgi:hypothetical protein
MRHQPNLLLFSFIMLAACSSPHAATPTVTPLPTAQATKTESPTPEPSSTDAPTPTLLPTLGAPTPITYEHSPRAILIEADLSPSVPMPRDSHVVTFRLYGDGFVVLGGDQTPLSSGLDATVRIGHLSELEMTSLLGFISQSGFLDLNSVYSPQRSAPDAMSAQVSIYLNQAKTVRVYLPDGETTPKVFRDVFDRIKGTIPADVQNFSPVDAFFQATPAGSNSNLGQGVTVGEWSNSNVRLAGASNGVIVSGSAYAQIAVLVSKRPANDLYREGDQVYRLRFGPNLPRAQHLTDWVGAILDGTREFSGRVFEITGYYRGANLFGEARGDVPNARNVWVVADAGGAMYAAGMAPAGLNPNSRPDAWTVVRLRGTVTYVRLGTSYIQVQRVDVLSTNIQLAPTATLIPSLAPERITNADGAIARVKTQYPEVAKIQKQSAGVIGGNQNILVIDRADGWDLIFLESSGDCPAGCINNHYYYFSAKGDGRVIKAGEYARIYNSGTNSFEVSGAPMWGMPK